MSMKILLFCLLATVANAQDMANITAERIAELDAIQANYDTSIAEAARNSHLFCLTRSTVENEGIVTISDYEQNGENVWTLFFQMPLITFLDPQRKLSLMDTVMTVLDNGMTTDDICLGTYETYELSYFKESVLIRVYSRSSTPLDAATIATNFNNAITSGLSSNDGYVIEYPGQSGVIALNFSTSIHYTGLIQPTSETNEGVDLTSLAVFIGSYGYNNTFTEGVEGVSKNINDEQMRTFAYNTNPINYGLEPGDIVFAVIGSILLVIVSGLTLLGYCIHPFFLA